MKTPLQEFKDKFFENSRISNYQCPKGLQDEVIDLNTLNTLFDEMLEKEKKVIKDAYWEGGLDIPCYESTVVDWYNRTFKNEEQ